MIIIVGTSARGGIKAVIDAYTASGFYTPGHSIFLVSHREGAGLQRMWVVLQSLARMSWLLLMGGVDLVHVHSASRGSFWRKSLFVLMSRMFCVPVIIHLHGGGFADFYEKCSAWKQRYVRHVLNLASTIVVLSQYWQEFVRTLTQTPVRVISNFVPDQFDAGRVALDRHYGCVLFLGQLGLHKGIYVLLPVFAEIALRFPDVRLICGGNGEIDMVRETVAALGATKVIEVPGWVSGPEKDALMRRCGIFVLPSYNEGLPMAIIEAMSFSMVVVATRVGGIPELVDDSNGVLITPGNHDELQGALYALLAKDDQTLAAMGAASRRKYLQAFTPTACMSEMHALYLSLGVTP